MFFKSLLGLNSPVAITEPGGPPGNTVWLEFEPFFMDLLNVLPSTLPSQIAAPYRTFNGLVWGIVIGSLLRFREAEKTVSHYSVGAVCMNCGAVTPIDT